MASNETWKKCRYFNRDSSTDNWGDPSAIADDLILALDDFRHYIGFPILITRGVATKGHAKNSYHYGLKDKNGKWITQPCAADIIIPDYDKGPVDLILDVTRFGFTGIGYYAHWNYHGKQVGGLHVDTRPLKWDSDETLNYRHSRWVGVKDNLGVQRYLPMSLSNIMTNLRGDANGLS